jgi:methyl-accepting chemotaxis protein
MRSFTSRLSLSGLPISLKVLVAPFILAVAILAMALVFNSGITRLSGAIDSLFNTAFAKDRAVNGMLYSAASIQSHTYRIMSWQSAGVDAGKIDVAAKQVQAETKSLIERTQTFDQRHPADATEAEQRKVMLGTLTAYAKAAQAAVDMATVDAGTALAFMVDAETQYDKLVAILEAVAKTADQANRQSFEDAVATAQDGKTSYFIVLGIALAAGLAVVLLMSRIIAGPVVQLTRAMAELAKGNLDIAVPGIGRADEIGAMAETVEVFKTNALEKRRLEADSQLQHDASEKRRLEREAREKAAGEEIAALVNKVAQGDLSGRISESGKDGFFLATSQELNRLAGTLQTMTGEVAIAMSAMAGGDLTKAVRGEYQGVFGEIKGAVNGMAERLRDFAGRLTMTAQSVKVASGEISTGSQDLSQRTESQAASIEETAASMHEITTTVKQNADNAQAANQLAVAARDTAEKGGSVVANAVTAVTQIEDSARKISDIVGLIDEIAFQTNLLALNASVEAARAGEAGKGFAVVAQEVRALAQRSANASKDIKALINQSNAQVKTGAALVNQTGGSLTEIVTAIKKVSDIVAEIAAASREQATGLDQINTAVGSMDEATQRNAALVEETTAAAQSLNSQANELANLVGFFKLAGAAAAGPVVATPASAPVVRPAAAPARKPAAAPAAPAARSEEDWQEF